MSEMEQRVNEEKKRDLSDEKAIAIEEKAANDELFSASGPFYYEPDDNDNGKEGMLSPNPFSNKQQRDDDDQATLIPQPNGFLSQYWPFNQWGSKEIEEREEDDEEDEFKPALTITQASYAPSESTLATTTAIMDDNPITSYHALQQQQAAMAKRYLRDLQVRDPPNNTLLPLSNNTLVENSGWNPDWPWSAAYVAMMFSCFVHSAFYGKWTMLPVSSSLLYPWLLSTVILVSIMLCWLWLLQRYPQKILWLMAVSIPAGGAIGGFICLFTWSTGWGILLLVFSALLVWWGKVKFNLPVQVGIWRTAAMVIWERPQLMIWSATLMASMTLIGWWWAVNWWFLVTNAHWWTISLYSMTAAWTVSIILAIQRVIVGSIVTRWYFCRQTPSAQPSLSTMGTVRSLHGQICFAASLLTSIKLLRQSIALLKQLPTPTIANRLTQSMALIVSLLERLGEHVSSHALYWLCLNSHQSFCEAGKSVWRIYRRNLLTSLTTTSLTSGILTTLTWLTSLLCLILLHGSLGTTKAVLAAWLCWCEAHILFSIVRDTIEASFLCYAIDLDTERVHCQSIHQAYASFLTNSNR